MHSWIANFAFNPPDSRDFVNLNENVYCAPPYHNSSPCENLKFNEELNNEKAMKRDASPFCNPRFNVTLCKKIEKGIIRQFFQISTFLSRKHLWTFASSPIGFKTILQL
jgi:hypothetical protein